jgi:hypothetical protein
MGEGKNKWKFTLTTHFTLYFAEKKKKRKIKLHLPLMFRQSCNYAFKVLKVAMSGSHVSKVCNVTPTVR